MEIKKILVVDGQYRKEYIDLQTYCYKDFQRKCVESFWDEFDKTKCTLMGNFENETLISSMTIHNYKICLDRTELKMGGIGNVATSPIYRNRNACSKLLKAGLKQMHDDGMAISFLGPFKYEFYEKYGWKWCFNKYFFEFEIEALKNFKIQGEFKIAKKEDFQILNSIYDSCTQNLNGVAKRDKDIWESKFLSEAKFIALYSNMKGEASGYIEYSLSDDSAYFNVNEIMYKDFNTLRNLLAFIYVHTAQVGKVTIQDIERDNLLDVLASPRVSLKSSPDMMARIVDAEKVLKAYTYMQDGSLSLRVIDNECEWNNQTFQVVVENKIAKEITKAYNGNTYNDVELSIQDLTQLLMGFRTFKDLVELHDIKFNGDDIGCFFKNYRSQTALYEGF